MVNVWVPFDDALQRACDVMSVGDLVHGEAFSLFDAMSAVECGNPKMDAAVAAARSSVEELIAAGAAPVAELTADQLIEVLDRLLVLEVGWLDGGPLAQTIYTCLYMLRPERLEAHPVLLAYCQALKATVQSVRTLAVLGGVAEEEDLAYHVAGLPVDDSPTPIGGNKEDRCLEDLYTALKACSLPQDAGSSVQLGTKAQRDALRARLQYRCDFHQALAALDRKSAPEVAAAAQHFASASALLSTICSGGGGAANSPSPSASASQGNEAAAAAAVVVGAGPPGFDMDVNRHLLGPAPPRVVKLVAHEEACGFLKAMLAHLGLATELSKVASYRALQAAVQRFARLAASALPRSVAHYLLTPKAWVGPDSKAPLPLPACVPGRNMLAAAIGLPASPVGPATTVEQATAPFTAGAAPAVAAGEGATANGGAGTHAGGAVATGPGRAAAAAAGPCGAAPEAGPVPAALPAPGPELELFLEQATIAASNWVQAMLMNRSRQRRRLRRGFEDWSNLYEHGINADVSEDFNAFLSAAGWDWKCCDSEGQYVQGILGAWVEHHTSMSILQHLLMGFALELYHPHEYAMIYWYCDYLLSISQNCMQALGEHHPLIVQLTRKQQELQAAQLRAAAAGAAPSAARAGGSKRGGRGGKAGKGMQVAAPAAANGAGPEAEPTQLSLSPVIPRGDFPQMAVAMVQDVQVDHHVLEVERHMCQAMLRLMVGLSKANLVKTPYGPDGAEPPFNSEVQRYDQRFAILHSLPRPDPLFYDQYVMSVQASDVEVTTLLHHGAEALLKARSALTLLSKLTPAGKPEAATELLVGWRALERVVVQNCVAVNVLMSGLQAGRPLSVTFDFSHHATFPVMVVKAKKDAPKAAAQA